MITNKIMTTEEILKKLGGNIKKLRESKGISQQDLAAKCNFESTNMSRIEAGRSNFTVSTLHKIANSLGVTIKDLF